MNSTPGLALAPFVSSLTLMLAPPVHAQGGMQDLGVLPGSEEISHAKGVSADGGVIVGIARGTSGGNHAFQWTTAAGMQDLGTLSGANYSEAHAVSSDGLVVVGYSTRPFRWTAATGMQEILTPGWSGGFAYGVNGNGSVVVGKATNSNFESHAFRWTATTGMQDLGTLGGISSAAFGVSADGTVVVGETRDVGNATRPFRFDAFGGMQALGGNGHAYAVSADGSVVVGRESGLAFRWTASTGMQHLNLLPGFPFSSAYGVSADGSVVVGILTPSSSSLPDRAFRWTATTGTQMIGTLMGTDRSRANAASSDGSVVVGWSYTQTIIGGGFMTEGPAFRWELGLHVPIGDTYCSTVPNSTGLGGVMGVSGSRVASANFVQLSAESMPSNAFGFFLTSLDPGFAFPVNNSQGILCLGGSIGRFIGPGQVLNSGASGQFSLDIDLTAMPTPTGGAVVQPGETWHFQAWHRDANPTLTSNFTDAVAVDFQ